MMECVLCRPTLHRAQFLSLSNTHEYDDRPPTFVFQQILPGFSAGHEANFDAVAFRRVRVFLTWVADSPADRGAATEPRLFDDREHVTVNAETFQSSVIHRYWSVRFIIGAFQIIYTGPHAAADWSACMQ